MITCVDKGSNGGMDILVDGQVVLNIDEVSDNETINLFLRPVGKDATIIETMKCTSIKVAWSHELLTHRR